MFFMVCFSVGRERLLPAGLNVEAHPPSGASRQGTAAASALQALGVAFVDGCTDTATKPVKRFLARSHIFSRDLAALRKP
jgi:hypothetical protein